MHRTLIKIAYLTLVLVFGVSVTSAIAQPCVCASGLDCPHCGEKTKPVHGGHGNSTPTGGDCCTEPTHTACDAEIQQAAQITDFVSQPQTGMDDISALAVSVVSGALLAIPPPSDSYGRVSTDFSNPKVPIYLQIQSFLC
jgi:hypothetical protein